MVLTVPTVQDSCNPLSSSQGPGKQFFALLHTPKVKKKYRYLAFQKKFLKRCLLLFELGPEGMPKAGSDAADFFQVALCSVFWLLIGLCLLGLSLDLLHAQKHLPTISCSPCILPELESNAKLE